MEIDTGIYFVGLPPLLSQSRFAVFIGKEEKTVRSWVTTRAIPTVIVGGSRLINLERLHAELAAGKHRFSAGDYEE